MSLRAKLIWAFVLVAAGALLLAFATSNLGLHASMWAMHYRMHGAPMGWDVPLFLRAALTWSVWGSLAALGIAAVVGVMTANRITRPLRDLRDAAAQLDLRDLSRRVPVVGQDEIAELAAAFNRMCDRLEADERSRRQLLADIAHELRHPLAVMQGHVDLLQDGKVEMTPEALLAIQDEIIRLNRLVGDLRDLSLAEVGRLSLHLTTVSPEAVLRSLMADLGPVAAAKGVNLELAVPPGLPHLVADPDRLRQILVNLLTNALRYTPPGGRVLVEAEARAGELWVSVTDSGPGIDPADLPHVFDRFYRADKARTRETGASGLGLAIVRSLVELHGGRVTAESEPGKGSRFTVILPMRA